MLYHVEGGVICDILRYFAYLNMASLFYPDFDMLSVHIMICGV